jgi:ferrous iron transport protein A
MHMMWKPPATCGNDLADTAPVTAPRIPLGEAHRGFCGRIVAIHVSHGAHSPSAPELESRLLELGFVEGADIEVLHEGPFCRDPIAVRVNDTTIALRRREAMAILVVASDRSA